MDTWIKAGGGELSLKQHSQQWECPPALQIVGISISTILTLMCILWNFVWSSSGEVWPMLPSGIRDCWGFPPLLLPRLFIPGSGRSFPVGTSQEPGTSPWHPWDRGSGFPILAGTNGKHTLIPCSHKTAGTRYPLTPKSVFSNSGRTRSASGAYPASSWCKYSISQGIMAAGIRPALSLLP